jgi:hypothetical protein
MVSSWWQFFCFGLLSFISFVWLLVDVVQNLGAGGCSCFRLPLGLAGCLARLVVFLICC